MAQRKWFAAVWAPQSLVVLLGYIFCNCGLVFVPTSSKPRAQEKLTMACSAQIQRREVTHI
jgi:hypothetical protein